MNIRNLLLSYLMLVVITGFSQQVDSTYFNLIETNDSFRLEITQFLDDGRTYFDDTPLIDSATMYSNLERLKIEGGSIGSNQAIELRGERQISRARQIVFDRESRRRINDVEGFIEIVIDGGRFDSTYTYFDNTYLGEWRIIGPDSTFDITLSRNNSGRLRARGIDNDFNEIAVIYDRRCFEIRNLGGSSMSEDILFVRRLDNNKRYINSPEAPDDVGRWRAVRRF